MVPYTRVPAIVSYRVFRLFFKIIANTYTNNKVKYMTELITQLRVHIRMNKRKYIIARHSENVNQNSNSKEMHATGEISI